MSRPKLPDFVNPPVTEVALSIQFETIDDLRAIHLGALWERFGKKQFPSVEEQPTIPKTFESFKIAAANVMPQFELLNMPPLPRFLFISSAGTDVIQVQPDRFTFNWRKRSDSDTYPRYEAIEAKFSEYLNFFVSFLREEKLGSIKILQGEVTYVNQIPGPQLGNSVEKVISILSGDYTDEYLHSPEQVRLSLTFPLKRDNIPYGRLHVDASTSTQGDVPSMNLALVARGMPEGTDIKAATKLLRECRTSIVTGFASITAKEMHKTWGRTDHASDEN